MISVVIKLDWNIIAPDILCLKQQFSSLEAAEAFMQGAAASNSFIEVYDKNAREPEQLMHVNVKHVAYFTLHKERG
jgi:hypothetical protein